MKRTYQNAIFGMTLLLVTPLHGYAAQLETGQKVMDRSGNVITVNQVFEDGRVTFIDNPNTRSVSDLSPEVPKKGGIQAGMKVLDFNDNELTVSRVFEDGRVSVFERGRLNYDPKVDQLATRVSDMNGIKVGAHVLDVNNRVQEVLTVYSNGKVVLAGDPNIRNVNDLASEVRGIPMGVKAIDRNGRTHTISKMFSDGRVTFLDENGAQNLKHLSIESTHASRFAQLLPKIPSKPSLLRRLLKGSLAAVAGAVAVDLAVGESKAEALECSQDSGCPQIFDGLSSKASAASQSGAPSAVQPIESTGAAALD